MTTDHDQKDTTEESDSLSLWQVISSALSAALGVQSEKNRNRDFTKGKPSQFIVAGLIFTTLFVVAMIGIVNLIISSTAN